MVACGGYGWATASQPRWRRAAATQVAGLGVSIDVLLIPDILVATKCGTCACTVSNALSNVRPGSGDVRPAYNLMRSSEVRSIGHRSPRPSTSTWSWYEARQHCY
jgi:hypothetical protein